MKECGWKLNQIFLFGFAQGGTLALEYLFWLNENNKEASLGGVIGISTQLLGARRKLIQQCREKKDCSTQNTYSIKTPILLIHGQDDLNVLPKHNVDSVNCLKESMDADFINSGFTYKMFKNRDHVMLRGANREEMKIFYSFMANNLNGVGKKKEYATLKELEKKEGLIPL